MTFPVKNENLFVPELLESMKAINGLPTPLAVTYDLVRCADVISKQMEIVSFLRISQLSNAEKI